MKPLPALLLVVFSLTGIRAHAQGMAPTAANTSAADTPSTCWQASVTAENSKDYATALQQTKNFQQTGGDPFLASLRLGWLDYLQQDYKSARDNYDAAVRLQPVAINPLLGLLNVAQAQADANEIRKAVDDILHVDPLNYRAQMAGAVLQFKIQNYREALSYYRRVLQYYPDDFSALSGEAWSLYYLDQKPAAVADFQTLLSVNPDYPYARQGLALAQGKPATPSTQSL